MGGQLGTWIVGLVGPMVIRAIIALGFSAVSFATITQVMNGLLSIAQQSWSALPLTVLQLASLSGIPQGLGMVFAAWMARATLWVAVNGTKYLKTR